MASINNVVTVSLLEGNKSAMADNVNVVAIITTDNSFLNSYKRYAAYKDIESLVADFGSSSKVAEFAQVFFAQSPNPVNAGGELIVGYWRNADETMPATSGYLTSAELAEGSTVSKLQKIISGSMSISIDGAPINLTGIDFSVVDSMDDVVVILQSSLSPAIVTWDGVKLKIKSSTTGASSIVEYATGSGATFVGDILGLTSGSGANKVVGQNTQVLVAENEIDALTTLKADVAFKGFMFIPQSTPTNRKLIANWCQANRTLGYDVFYDPYDLTRDQTISTAWAIKLAGDTYYRMLYSKANNRKLATGYMSRAHTVNFNANNSAQTMAYKEIKGVTPEDYTQNEIDDANVVGLDLYTTIKNVPVILASSGNDFTDNVYNLISYIEEVQIDVFNLLTGTATKVPQTTPGVDTIVNTVTKTTERYVNAGVFAPGEWTNATTFGDLEAFKRAIRQDGYFILAGLLANQSPADREARKSPVIQIAVKNAGAIQHADIIIIFNK
jgi:hypothetical protein